MDPIVDYKNNKRFGMFIAPKLRFTTGDGRHIKKKKQFTVEILHELVD